VQLPAYAQGETFSGEPDAGKSACPVRRGESGSHRKVSPSLLLYSLLALHGDVPLARRASSTDDASDRLSHFPLLPRPAVLQLQQEALLADVYATRPPEHHVATRRLVDVAAEEPFGLVFVDELMDGT
jgi:hypothetical protein